MSKFGNLGSIQYGENKISQINVANKEMLMDISVIKLKKGSQERYQKNDKEIAVLLLTGKLEIEWLKNNKIAERHSVFDEDPWCIHVPHGVEIIIKALEESEIIIQSTDNDKDFSDKFYAPEDCQSDIFGKGVWNDTARRIVRTIFDYHNAPYSNMVMGEVITFPGKWSSYPPHYHPQPEVYYYKFDKPQGLGLCLIGDTAHKISDNSYVAISGGEVHPQTSAPGYAMYYCWMIRHLKDNPWTDRIDIDEHKWLWDKNVKIWPEN